MKVVASDLLYNYSKVGGLNDARKFFKLKRELLKLKKRGEIYIDVPISSLELNTKIDFYHKIHPGTEKTYDAFPMPRHIYGQIRCEKKLIKLIKKYHKEYYRHNDPSKIEIVKYDLKPFKGKETVWFSKKQLFD